MKLLGLISVRSQLINNVLLNLNHSNQIVVLKREKMKFKLFLYNKII